MFKAERLKIQSRLQNYRASDCFYREKRRAVKNVFQKYLGSYLSSMEVEIFKKLKRHWPTVMLAVVVGLLMVWPFFYFQKSLGDEYRGILNQIIDDELFYMARIKDVNFDIVQGRILYNFFLPALAFILTYLVFYLIYPSKFWANIFAVFLFFGIYLFKFTRPVIPQFVFLFWLAQFILLWQIIKNPSNRIFIFLNILNFGLLFYLYPFYWTFYLVLLSVSSFIYFFRDRLYFLFPALFQSF